MPELWEAKSSQAVATLNDTNVFTYSVHFKEYVKNMLQPQIGSRLGCMLQKCQLSMDLEFKIGVDLKGITPS
jgi:hypothetical protein